MHFLVLRKSSQRHQIYLRCPYFSPLPFASDCLASRICFLDREGEACRTLFPDDAFPYVGALIRPPKKKRFRFFIGKEHSANDATCTLTVFPTERDEDAKSPNIIAIALTARHCVDGEYDGEPIVGCCGREQDDFGVFMKVEKTIYKQKTVLEEEDGKACTSSDAAILVLSFKYGDLTQLRALRGHAPTIGSGITLEKDSPVLTVGFGGRTSQLH